MEIAFFIFHWDKPGDLILHLTSGDQSISVPIQHLFKFIQIFLGNCIGDFEQFLVPVVVYKIRILMVNFFAKICGKQIDVFFIVFPPIFFQKSFVDQVFRVFGKSASGNAQLAGDIGHLRIFIFHDIFKGLDLRCRKIDGEEAARVIYTPAITHPREHFSTESVGYMLDFFDRALDAPNPIASSSQIWPVMTFFKALGLVSWIFVFITFALCMLDTKYFSSLRVSGKETVVAPLPRHEGKKGLAWFWLPLIGCGLINGTLFVALQSAIIQKPTIISFWPQTSSLGIGVWSAVSAVISIAVFILYYRTYGKNHGYNLKERGTLISKDKVVKTVLLALLTVLVGFAVLFGVDYFFNTDFRFYLSAARPFNSELFFIALRFLPFFLISHIVNAIVINGPFYNDIGSKRWKHGNLIIVCFFNILGMLIMWAFQYITFYVTGTKPLAANLGTLICFIWMVPLIFNLISTSVISRTIYRKSGNPYIGAIINAFLVTFVQCASTTTVFMGMSSNSYLPM